MTRSVCRETVPCTYTENDMEKMQVPSHRFGHHRHARTRKQWFNQKMLNWHWPGDSVGVICILTVGTSGADYMNILRM